ncbi:hypothetical protein [Aurantimonas sp. Leaf443]|uniref:hypothetical protein n=1 Tax=Aurantimonas sp. Leaf443 TaxID=1736378 RepID=UPI0006FC3551|nr:hypothetical protein [Aurantimonas sp. Leaf443]KQT86842.1 hypothetical protein ASG48_17550 [Aurantimonas sp. Leaf443]
MTIILTSRRRSDALDAEILRVRDLLLDLHHLREHGMPPSGVLAKAPLFSDWRPAARMVPCLVGQPSGHPHVSGRRRAMTSPLWVLSTELGFARTESRIWRLEAAALERFDA